MASLEIGLLGGFQLRLGGHAIDLPGRRERALLAYLAMPPGQSHSREKLAGVLWSERGDKQARDSLKQAVLKLRKALDGVQPTPLPTDREFVTLDPAAVSVDVAEFERLMGEGTPEAVARATVLYRGDLLDGFEAHDPAFEDWLQIERRRLRDLACEALAGLLDRRMADGRYDQAAVLALRLVALDPLRESAHRALMRIYAEQGQTAHALKQYARCREALQRELGVGPEAETDRLYQAIRQNRSTSKTTSEQDSAEPHGADQRFKPGDVDAAALTRPSIAVLPFVNLSGNPEQEYFSKGITDDIITELTRFRSLFVIARNSSFQFRDQDVDVKRVGRALGVQYLVRGSVRAVGDRLRISVQLIDAATDNPLWAERYDRDLGDILAIQAETAQAIATAASARTDHAERSHAMRLAPSNLRAYHHLLRGRELRQHFRRESNQQAQIELDAAIRLDPSLAEAHAELSGVHLNNRMLCWVSDRTRALAMAFVLAQQGFDLDERSTRCRRALGMAHLFRREHDDAGLHLETGIELNPNDSRLRAIYGFYLCTVGRIDDALRQFDIVAAHDPLDEMWIPWVRGIALFTARRYEAAIANFKQVANPNTEIRGWLAASLAHAGRIEEAKAVLDDYLSFAESDMAVFPGRRLRDWEDVWHGAIEYRDQKDFDHLFDALHKAGLSE